MNTIEKWSHKNASTGKRQFFFHVKYANGNLGDSEKFASHSGRDKRVAKLVKAEPETKVVTIKK